MAKEKRTEVAKPDYVMPNVETGDSVFWHDEQDGPVVAMALVTGVYQETVSLAVLGSGFHNFFVREGVRHKNHPDRKIVASSGEGVWSHRQSTIDIEQRLQAAEAIINQLVK